MYWDKAASTGRSGDFSAGALASEDKDKFVYIELVTRGRWTPFERERMIVKMGTELYELYGRFPIWHQQDPAAAGKESAQLTNGRLAEASLFGRSESVTERMNEIYAEDLSTLAQAGKMRLVRGAWNGPFLEELLAYPAGTHDDQVVVVSGAVKKVRKQLNKKVASSYQG
jgi:phage terminase large subunit-like protein